LPQSTCVNVCESVCVSVCRQHLLLTMQKATCGSCSRKDKVPAAKAVQKVFKFKCEIYRTRVLLTHTHTRTLLDTLKYTERATLYLKTLM